MATLGGVLAVQHKAQQSQDSGADLDWSSEDSGGSPVLLRQMEDVEESFVTVVQVGGGNAEVPSPGVEKPDTEATPESFVTVLSIGDDEKGVSLNVGCDSGVIEEEVLVYRLPGERLGFGLKFEGGAQSTEKVRRLFIQSCAPDSPASRARASWGPLQEGDEVLAIDSAPVDRMTRIDCVRCLKESHVVIQLRVRHVSSPPPQVVGAEVKKMLPPPPSMPPPPIPPRKGSRKNHQAIVGPPTAFADTNTTPSVPERPQHVNGDLSELWNKDEEGAPPEAEVYLDVVSQEAAWAGESESDDTGSSISTVVDRLSTANSSFSASTCPSTPTTNATANSIDLQRVLDPFEQLEREFQTDSDFLLARTLADTPATSASMSIMSAVDDPSVAVPLQPPLSFQDAPLSYGDEKFVSSIKKSEKESNEDDDLSVDNHLEETIPTTAPTVPALPPKPAPRREVPTSKFRSGKKRPPPPPPPPVRAERSQAAKLSAENIQTIPVLKPETAALPRLVDVVPKERDDRSLGALPDVIGHVTERDKTDEIWDEVDRLIQDVGNSNKKQTLHISEKVETLNETKALSIKQDEILQSVSKELNLTLPADSGTLHVNSVSSSWETIPLNDEPTFTMRDFEAEVGDITSKNATLKSAMDKKIHVNTTPSKYENIEVFFSNDSSKASSIAVTSAAENVSCVEQEKQSIVNNDFIVRDGSPVKMSTESGYENNEVLVSKGSQVRTNPTVTLDTSANGGEAEADLMILDSPVKTDSPHSTVKEDSLISFDSPVKVHPPVDIQHIPPESPPKTASLVRIDSPIKADVFTSVDASIISYLPTETSSLIKMETEMDSPSKAEVSSVHSSVVNTILPVEASSLPSSPIKTDSAPTNLDSHPVGSCEAPLERDSSMKESLIEESSTVNNDSQVNMSSPLNPDTVFEEDEAKESTLVSPKQNVELVNEEDISRKPVLNTVDSFPDDEMLLKITSTEIENNTTSIDLCLEPVTTNTVTKQENVTEESSPVTSDPADEKNAVYCKPGKEDVLFKMDSTMIRSDSLPLKLSPVHVTEELLLLKADSPIAVGKTKVSVEVDGVIESSVDDEFPVEELKGEFVSEELGEECENEQPRQDNMYLKEELMEITSISPCDDDRFFDVGQSPELIEKEESVDPPENALEGNDSDTDSDEFHLALGDLENGSSVFQPAATDAGFFPFRCWGAACHLATIGEDEEEAESSVPTVPGFSVEDEEEKEMVEEEREEEGDEEEEEEVELASKENLEDEHGEKIEERKEEDEDDGKEEVYEAELKQEDKHEEELVEAAVDDDDEEEDQVDANPVPSPASRLDEIVMNAIPEPSSEICEDALELPTEQISDPEPPISVVQPHEPANGGAEDLHQLCRAAEVTAEKSDSDIGTMEDALQALDSLTSSCSSRLPPDGHEFPPNYQEVAPQEIMMPPPPLPVSGPPAKLEEPTRSPWRSKDERSECSVKDKIAMFSQQQSATSSPTRRRFNSTEDVFRDSSSVLSFKSQDSLYKSQETLYPSKTQDYLYNGKPSDTSYKVEEPLYTSTRVQDPLYTPKTQEPYSPKIQEPTLSAKSVNSFYSSTKTVETQLPNKSSDTLYSSSKTDSIYSNTNGQESLYSSSKTEPLYTASKVPESVFSSTKSQETSYPSTKIQESLYPSKTVQDTYFASSRPLYSGNKGLYKSQEALYPGSKVQESFFSKSADSGCTSSASSSCSSSAYSSCSPESSLTYSTLPRKLQNKPAATPTLSRATSFSGTLHSRSQSLIDIGPAATGHLKTEEMRRASLNALIEQRRRGYSKLRGLVIPEKVSEASHAIPDLPEIRSVITVAPTATRVTSSSTSTTTSSTTNRWSNNIGQLPTTIPSPPWKNQAQNNVSNLPKYSPAFKRKSLSVYTSSKPAGLNLKPSTTPPLRSPCEDESDGDSAVSVSPPPGRVLKAQSVEAINRKNVLSSARHSSGCDLKVGSPLITRKFDEPLHRSDEDDADEEDEDGEEPPTRIAYMEEVVEEDDLPPPPIPVAPIPEKPKPLPAPRRTSIPTPKRQSAPLPPPKPTVSPPPSPGDDLLSLLTGGSQLRRQRSRESCETSRIPTSTTVRSNNEISRVPALAVGHEKIDSSRIPSPPTTRENLEQSRIPSPPSEKKEAPLFSSSIKKLETTPSPVSLVSKEKPDTASVSPPLNIHESTYSPSTLTAQENMETSIPLRTREKPESLRISSLSASRDSPDILQNPTLPASDPPRISATHNNRRSVSVHDIRKAFEKAEQALSNTGRSATSGSLHARVSSLDSTTSEDCNFRGIGDQFGSVTSIASSTSLISPQDLQVLIDEANQPLEDSAVPVPVQDVQVVVLHREGTTGSVGIILAGGADYEAKEITVHKVLSGSPADKDGRIQKGDRILSINGRSMKGVTHRESLNILKAPRSEVVLVVSQSRAASGDHDDDTPVTTTRSLRHPRIPEQEFTNGPTEVEPSEGRGPPTVISLIKDGAGLGFSLEGGKDSPQGDRSLTIKKIFTGGSAEKNGQLKAGDELLNVNGTDVTVLSRIEAWGLMKRLPDGPVSLTVRHKLATV